jgi:hypothetical protein
MRHSDLKAKQEIDVHKVCNSSKKQRAVGLRAELRVQEENTTGF